MSGRPLSKLPRPNSRHSVAASKTAERNPISVCVAHFIRTHQYINSNSLPQVIKTYAPSQTSLHEARSAFAEINKPSLPFWNHIIRGLSQSDRPGDALVLFDKMRELGFHGDNRTFIFLCKACARIPSILYGKRIHAIALKLGYVSYLYVCNALIHMYGFCGELDFARKVFFEIPERDLVSWNSLICAFSQCEQYEEVLGVFDQMRVENVKADAVTMVKVVLACNYLGKWKLLDSMVKYIEDSKIEIDVFLGNTLIDAFGKRGLTTLAWNVFDRMGKRNVVSWNAMIIVAAKAGDCASAKKLFDEMPERDVYSWTSMITACAQANQHEDAIQFFQEMMADKVKPDQVTLASALSACAHLGRLDVGNAIHEYIARRDITLDIYVENALIYMYCKCGSIDKAMKVFQNMRQTDSVSWNSVICGAAINGKSSLTFDLFTDMLGTGIRPVHGTFIGLLLACVHSGLVEEGLGFFHSMQREYGLVPEMRHYGCVVDLFCRSGYLVRAYEFIKNMPVFPDVVIWRMLLSACKVYGDMDLAKIASDKVLELDPSNGVDYIISSNAYASVERWDDAMKMREQMEKHDALKPLGWSSIQTNTQRAQSFQTHILDV